MGNSSKSKPQTTSLNEGYDYSKTNNKRIEMILKKVEKQKPVFPEYQINTDLIKSLGEFCNENGLEIISPSNKKEPLNTGRKGVINIRDPNTGIIYSFDEFSLKFGTGTDKLDEKVFVNDSIKDNFQKTILETRNLINDTNPQFTKTLKKINFSDDHHYHGNELGNFNKDDPNAITITPSVFGRYAEKTGLKGLLYHETSHNYEYNTYGDVGALKHFSDLKSYPTKYGATEYTGKYDGARPESFSTTVEQVSTHTLRDDALMKNGNTVKKEYYSKHKKRGSPSELYDMWEKEWLPQVNEVKQLTGIID